MVEFLIYQVSLTVSIFSGISTVTNEAGTEIDKKESYNLHIEKLKSIYKLLNNEVTGDDLITLELSWTSSILRKSCEIRKSFVESRKLKTTDIVKEEYPILSDFYFVC